MPQSGVLVLLMRPGAALRAVVLPGLIALLAITLVGCSSSSNSSAPSTTISAGKNCDLSYTLTQSAVLTGPDPLLGDAMAQLSAEHRAVIRRSYYQGWTTAQIAEDLQIPEGTVKSRLHYAMRTLRLALQEMGVTR